MTAYFENEIGKVNIGTNIIRQIVVPELSKNPNFLPAYAKLNADRTAEIPSEARGVERGINIQFIGNELCIEVPVFVKYQVPITAAAKSLQENIKRSVEAATGLPVARVDINVEKVYMREKDKEFESKKETSK